MNAIDTNILIYAHDPRDPRKQEIAAELVRSQTDGVLLWQVACEYAAASRKLAPYGFSVADALNDVCDFRRIWRTALPRWTALDRAADLLFRFSLSFWDAVLVAHCREAGVTRLYSEDFGPYPEIDGVRIIDPFVG